MILFLYKICIGTYPNPGLDLSTLVDDPRTGITIAPKLDLRADSWVSTVRGASFFNKAPQLFNIIPKELRQHKYLTNPTPKHIEEFKSELDKYLVTVPDEPTTDRLQRAAESNSILHQQAYRLARGPDAQQLHQNEN